MKDRDREVFSIYFAELLLWLQVPNALLSLNNDTDLILVQP